MNAWLSYRPEDFLLFSERAYWRLFERTNLEAWPWQIPILLLGLAAIFLVLRPWPFSHRALFAGLALAWVWAGVHFLGQAYAQVNWVATYASYLFAIEACLLALFGTARGEILIRFDTRASKGLGLVLFIYGLALHPLIAPLAGRGPQAAEVIGLAPDPTAIATLGLLTLAARSPLTGILLVIPLFWCLASAATLFTLGAVEAWIPLGAALIALGVRLWGARLSRPDRGAAPGKGSARRRRRG